MSRMLFLTLPVADPARSRAFYEALGFSINETFTDESTTCVVVSDQAILMLASRAKLAELTTKTLADPATTATNLVALSCATREEVDEIVATAIAHGGTTTDEPQDYGFMYDHSFVDPDGNGFGVVWMAQEAIEGGPAQPEAETA